MEEYKNHLSRVSSLSNGFVGNGKSNLRAGYRAVVTREVQAKYAPQMIGASRTKRLWLKLKIRVEIWSSLRKIGSDYSLYLCDFGSVTRVDQ